MKKRAVLFICLCANLSHLLAFRTTAFIAYWISVYIYRVTLHPLAKFPGPKLTGATFWYKFYYNLFPHKLRFLWKIEDLYNQYGPIVRINPLHIHIRDPEYLDDIYTSGRRKRNRNDKRSIQALEDRVVDKIDILVDRIAEARQTGETVNLLFAAGTLTIYIISAYTFGKDWNKLGEPD
ncbi:Cytochrome P450 [Penicillium roqueforti FM164]|uniref:Cytochrome P450 n=1 Tax=Penicillium roqueforti (strain FM164) TaxID=1365484 RepID=W6PRP0_PENRF|nr:Cytochrome P450 [Penicillium roqueforti FM164]